MKNVRQDLGLHNVKLGGPGTSCLSFGPSLGDFYKPIFFIVRVRDVSGNAAGERRY
jgi:hypothetical protein